MKTFRCVCGNNLHFENTRCLVCERQLGFAVDRLQLLALEPVTEDLWRDAAVHAGQGHYRLCRNYAEQHVCNWLVAENDTEPYCQACRLNDTVPDLTHPENHLLWLRTESAKRRLLYTLYRLRLPLQGRDADNTRGLAFQFLASREPAEFNDAVDEQQVMTGHNQGVITINVAEADPVQRTVMREKMGEQYRTLLGHFRHEIGHYYWYVLHTTPSLLTDYRQVFGDERRNYSRALADYYQQGAPKQWPVSYISAYASAHPWEDFAETFAHYLHMVDTLDTAYDYDFAIRGKSFSAPLVNSGTAQLTSDARCKSSFDDMLRDWVSLTLVMNSLNRSMGLRDAYPFAITATISDKLRFVHRIIGRY
ncbi:MAG: putative zinc-binding peptidase [Gammaproteobacteria bacterium]|nr:putative zinc-binding peptidase [Gammaproteobacteria bacterium]